jgi:hypothetical protein
MTFDINQGVLHGNKNPDENPMNLLSDCDKTLVAYFSWEFKRIIYLTLSFYILCRC